MHRIAIALLLLAALGAQSAQAQDPKPSVEAKPAAAAPGQEPDPKIIEDIMQCLVPGLTSDWQRTWIIVTQVSHEAGAATRQYVAEFFYASKESDKNGRRMRTCGDESVLKGITALNAYLPESQRRWTSAVFTFYRDGRYAANYGYEPVPAASEEKPAPKKAAKKAPAKKQDAAKP